MNKKESLGLICVNCGIVLTNENVKGYMRHPYCKKCYKEIFKDNDEAYSEYINKIH